MNLSGKAVNYWVQKEKISADKLLIITDDISIDAGSFRLKPKGSDGGHNGLKSIQETLGTSNYSRLRFGVGNNFHKGQQVNYVLGEWAKEDMAFISKKIELAVELVNSFCTIGIDRTMNDYNNK